MTKCSESYVDVWYRRDQGRVYPNPTLNPTPIPAARLQIPVTGAMTGLENGGNVGQFSICHYYTNCCGIP